MQQLIIHACGHEQAHFLSGFASQQERKARWLQTTKCKTCFVAGKREEQAESAARDGVAIAHLDPPQLVGSDRQVAWATTIRAGRLASIVAASPAGEADGQRACLLVTDAKWWIDHRDLTVTDLLAKAKLQVDAAGLAEGSPTMNMPQAA